MKFLQVAAVICWFNAALSAGPLNVGDAVDVKFGGNWQHGMVTVVDGLTYFVHWGPESDNGKFDEFQPLYNLRPAGAIDEQTYADLYHDTEPDPAGGPVAIGQTVSAYASQWTICRVARRLGDRYVVFPEDPTLRNRVAEAWVWPDEIRLSGQTAPLGTRNGQPRPKSIDAVKVGDLIETYKRGGYGWFQATVMHIDRGRYYVQAAPDSAMKGWTDPVHMRAVGSAQRFEPEDVKQFIGDWKLAGDAFFLTTKSERHGDKIENTMTLNSGAGKDAGQVKINADGTYVLSDTVVFRDNSPGKWEKNPDDGEGGILLKGGDNGRDVIVTPHPNGRIYLQGSLRGPGKIGTK